MRRPEDSRLTSEQYAKIRREAQRVLTEANAIGRFPTPVSEIMEVAKVEEVADDVLNEGLVASMRRNAGMTLRRALSKVLGLFDARSRLVLIDRSLRVVKQTFIRLHETAHGFLPWQRDLYAVVEDCEQTLAPETAELFEREANSFASEVLFQLDGFSDEANQMPFGIQVPLKLGKRYGGSVYASVRRYVSRHHRKCVVLILDPPVFASGVGFRCNLRRVVASPPFLAAFGEIGWPEFFTPGDDVGAMVPLGKRRMSGKRPMELRDLNGDRRDCTAEAFTQGFQVFVLIHSSDTIRPLSIPVGSKSSIVEPAGRAG